jgi:RNA polymerase sigma-70 factor (ECF subfamily)
MCPYGTLCYGNVLICTAVSKKWRVGEVMIDEKIVDLYWARSEDAITETQNKYGNLCHSIAYSILKSIEDSQECVNDTYLKAWNSMPINRPTKLSAYLGKITRNLALNRYEYLSASKRGGTQTALVLDELMDCVSGTESTDSIVEEIYISNILNNFLDCLSEKNRNIFVARYWYLLSTKEIADKYCLKESYIRVSLHRSRDILKAILKKEGVF